MPQSLRMLQSAAAKLAQQMRRMITRGIVKLVVDDGELQRMQLSLLAGELRDGVEVIRHYGLASKPHAGAQAVVVFPNGSRDHGLVIATEDRRYRLRNLSDGEVALYSDLGQVVRMKRDRLEINAGSPGQVDVLADTLVRIVAPLAKVEGDLEVTGDTTLRGELTVEGNAQMQQELDVDGAADFAAPVHFHAVVTFDAHVDFDSDVDMAGPLVVQDDITATAGSIAATVGGLADSVSTLQYARDQYNVHYHSASGAPGPTSGPSTSM